MKTVKMRDLTIGTGCPKVIVPIVAKDLPGILAKANELTACTMDVVEWRVDFFEKMKEKSAVEGMLQELSNVLGDIPLLFTLRTDREGSSTHVETKEYEEILCHAAACPETDLIDVEVMPDPFCAAAIIDTAHTHGTPVIGSNHHFEGTPSNEEIDCIFSCMEKAGADILKMAVMPADRRDVVRMMERTLTWKEKTDRPLITMSMGALGCVSRMCGELTGSSVTFASVTAASAPGQIDMASLKNILHILHN